ncbi:hypothetical protein DXG01_016289 [Tephrocybe rancida]|nr:hypothetical protein DXG01_016289 [Tephrocybe rancida]
MPDTKPRCVPKPQPTTHRTRSHGLGQAEDIMPVQQQGDTHSDGQRSSLSLVLSGKTYSRALVGRPPTSTSKLFSASALTDIPETVPASRGIVEDDVPSVMDVDEGTMHNWTTVTHKKNKATKPKQATNATMRISAPLPFTESASMSHAAKTVPHNDVPASVDASKQLKVAKNPIKSVSAETKSTQSVSTGEAMTAAPASPKNSQPSMTSATAKAMPETAPSIQPSHSATTAKFSLAATVNAIASGSNISATSMPGPVRSKPDDCITSILSDSAALDKSIESMLASNKSADSTAPNKSSERIESPDKLAEKILLPDQTHDKDKAPAPSL